MAKSKSLLNVLNLVSEKELPVNEQFLNDLNASIRLQDAKNSRLPSQTYKPSSMHCIRNMYYQVIGVEPQADQNSAEGVGICESGTDRHERIQNAISAMKDSGIDCEYVNVGDYVEEKHSEGKLVDIEVVSQQGNETKLYNKKLNISFLCDGVIRYKGKYFIVEIKTEKSTKFWGRQGVADEHLLQGTAYSLNLELEDVIFVYECRDDCNKKSYLLHVTDEMRSGLSHKILECQGYVDRQITPPKPSDVKPLYCSYYCGYSKRCKNE